jgi:hypothetical protein
MNSAALRYFLARASERLTFAGLGMAIGVIGPLMGLHIGAPVVEAAVTAVTGLAGLALLLLPTGGTAPQPQPSPPGTTATDLNRAELARIRGE